MNTTQKFHHSLWWHAFKFLGRMIDESNQPKSVGQSQKNPNLLNLVPFLLTITGIFIFIGAEAEKVIYRRNFGKGGLDLASIILCFIGLLAAGIGGAYFQIDTFGRSQLKMLMAGFNITIFAFLALYVLIVGIKQWRKADDSNNNGDPVLLAVLTNQNWTIKRIKYVAEPLSLIFVGILFAPINIIGGMVLAFCGISVWFHAALDSILNKDSVNSNVPAARVVRFNPVSSD